MSLGEAKAAVPSNPPAGGAKKVKKKQLTVLPPEAEILLHECIELNQNGCSWYAGSDDIFILTDPAGLSRALGLAEPRVLIQALSTAGFVRVEAKADGLKHQRFFQYQGPADYAFSRQVCERLPRKNQNPDTTKEWDDPHDSTLTPMDTSKGISSPLGKRTNLLGQGEVPLKRLKSEAGEGAEVKADPDQVEPIQLREDIDLNALEPDQNGIRWVGPKPFRRPPPKVMGPGSLAEGEACPEDALDYSMLPEHPPEGWVERDPDDFTDCPEYEACMKALEAAQAKNKGMSVAEEVQTAVAKVEVEMEAWLDKNVRPKLGIEPGGYVDPLDERFNVPTELDQWWDVFENRPTVQDNKNWNKLSEQEKEQRLKDQEWMQRRRACHVAPMIPNPEADAPDLPFVDIWEELVEKITARFGYLEVIGIRDPPKSLAYDPPKIPAWCEVRNLNDRDQPTIFPHGFPMADHTRMHPPDILFLLDSFPDNDVFLEKLYQSPQKQRGTPDGDPDYMLDSNTDGYNSD